MVINTLEIRISPKRFVIVIIYFIKVEQITKEQNYQRYREERFRQTSESTNQRVLWWALAQTIILLAMGTWQMKHLKSFFEAKKLV